MDTLTLRSDTTSPSPSAEWRAETRLLTAFITYRRPDHLWLLQDYIWQEYDALPDYPKLHGFLKFWQATLEGPLVSVRVAVVHNRAAIFHDLYNFEVGRPN
jgi:uncharacterized protein Usg